MENKGFNQIEFNSFFEEFLSLFRDIDIYTTTPKGNSGKFDEIFGLYLDPYDLSLVRIDERFMDLLNNTSRIDGFLVQDWDKTIQLIKVCIRRAIVIYKRIDSFEIPHPNEIWLKGVLRYLIVDIYNSFGICKDEIEELFTIKEIQETQVVEQQRKAVKTLWNNSTRYKLVEQLGIIDMLIKGKLKKRADQNMLLSQIMGINEDTARKLIDGTYLGKTQPTEDMKLNEISELIELIKPKRV
jgi:hypothetical protein